MSALLSIGYIGLREAADHIAKAMFVGIADTGDVLKLRESGLNVSDGAAKKAALSEIWKAVDGGKLRAVLVGGEKRKIINLTSDQTHEIPLLRSTGGLSFSRPHLPISRQIRGWFGSDFGNIALAFRAKDVEKLGRAVVRKRRSASQSAESKKSPGRPSSRKEVARIIRDIIDTGKWSTIKSLKRLTQLANRELKTQVSEDTVVRTLDQLFKETKDRRYDRQRKPR